MKSADPVPVMTDRDFLVLQRVVAERAAAVLRSKPKPITKTAARKRRPKAA